MGWIIGAIVLYALFENSQGVDIFGQRPIASSGAQVPIFGGLSITLPGTTYHMPNGTSVVVADGAATGPGGYVAGLQSDGSSVWINPATGSVVPASGVIVN